MKTLAAAMALLAMSLLATPTLAASKIDYKAQPTSPEEQAVAKVVESFVETHGGNSATMATLFTEDAVTCCGAGGFGIQPRYEGGTTVARFWTSTVVSNKKATGLVVKTQGEKAETTGQYQFQIDLPQRRLDRNYMATWRLRKEPDGAWRIYEFAVQAQ